MGASTRRGFRPRSPGRGGLRAVTPYRTPPALPPDPYARAWRDLARWRAIGNALGVACAVAAVVFLVGHVVWPLVVAVGLGAGAGLHVGEFVCPHCESRFFRSGTKGRAKRCDKCGIQEGTPKSRALGERG